MFSLFLVPQKERPAGRARPGHAIARGAPAATHVIKTRAGAQSFSRQAALLRSAVVFL